MSQLHSLFSQMRQRQTYSRLICLHLQLVPQIPVSPAYPRLPQDLLDERHASIGGVVKVVQLPWLHLTWLKPCNTTRVSHWAIFGIIQQNHSTLSSDSIYHCQTATLLSVVQHNLHKKIERVDDTALRSLVFPTVLPSQPLCRFVSACLSVPGTQNALRSLCTLKITCSSFDERRSYGWWHGNTQVMHDGSALAEYNQTDDCRFLTLDEREWSEWTSVTANLSCCYCRTGLGDGSGDPFCNNPWQGIV